MTQTRPRIGIPMRIEQTTNRFYLGRDYSEAVVSELDGILLPGSDSDVDPLRYGQQPHPQLGTVQTIKDETDLLVIAAAERRRIPILAICFGMQILNVSRGGTLIQDINSQVPNAIKHEQGPPRDRPSHRIRLNENTRLWSLAGAVDALVNSHHHQAVESIGADLVATAWSTDGVVE